MGVTSMVLGSGIVEEVPAPILNLRYCIKSLPSSSSIY